MPTPRFGRAIRPQWLLEEGVAHLNHGSFGATPRRVLAAQERWRLAMERQPMRFFLDELPQALRRAADDLAGYVGAQGEDLAFVENASTAANAVLRSLELRPGDELLTTAHVYNAVGLTMQYVAERSGAVVKTIDLPFPPRSPTDLLELLEDAISDRTRIAVLDHITSATALVLPIEQAVALCRARGVPVFVDGAHAPGQLPLDLDALGADWYTGNAHKWLCAAKGCAFLWTRRDAPLRDAVHPTVISHPFGEGVPTEFDWVGTRDPSAWLSVTEALAFREDLGDTAVREHNDALCAYGAARLADALGVHPPVPPSMHASLAILPWDVDVPLDAGGVTQLRLWLRDDHGLEPMAVPFGGRMWLRISAQVYNEPAEYDRLAEVIVDPPFGWRA